MFDVMIEQFKPFFGIIIVVFVIIATLQVLIILKKKRPGDSVAKEYPFIKKNLFTQNELQFYKSLEPVAYKFHLTVFTKVRLADVIDTKKGLSKQEWGRYFNMIKAKHIDFVLCDKLSLNTIICIELDDKSHMKSSRKSRDNFVEKALESAKIPLLRVYDSANLESKIDTIFNPPESTPSS